MRVVTLPSALSVIGTDSYLARIRLGLGLAQVPFFHVQDALERGEWVEILARQPPALAEGAGLSGLGRAGLQLAERRAQLALQPRVGPSTSRCTWWP